MFGLSSFNTSLTQATKCPVSKNINEAFFPSNSGLTEAYNVLHGLTNIQTSLFFLHGAYPGTTVLHAHLIVPFLRYLTVVTLTQASSLNKLSNMACKYKKYKTSQIYKSLAQSEILNT